jgi:glycosyltransferase involved in cell wall biosynthesis
MKIAVWHNLPSGGGKRALYYHVRGLVEKGHHVEAWCPPTINQDYLPLTEFIQQHIVPMDIRTNRTSKFIANSPMLRTELHYDALLIARAQKEHSHACAEEINRKGFDILFANSTWHQAVSPIGRYVKGPKVLYLQEPYRPLYEAREGGLPWVAMESINRPMLWIRPRYMRRFLINLTGTQQQRLLAREEWLSARAFDRILVNSFFSRESLLRAYGIDPHVCYLGVDTQLFVDHQETREDFVVSLGAIELNKNVEFIIKAVAKIPPPRPRLLWIGNACNQYYYEQMCGLAEESGVCFEARTNINDTELVNVLNRAAVMAYAPHLEPFGFAPLEALACGLPVVAVAEGGVRETIVDGVNGLLVSSEPEAMAAGIERLLRDRKYAEQLGKNGSEIVAEKWSVDAAVARLEQELQAVIG